MGVVIIDFMVVGFMFLLVIMGMMLGYEFVVGEIVRDLGGENWCMILRVSKMNVV